MGGRQTRRKVVAVACAVLAALAVSGGTPGHAARVAVGVSPGQPFPTNLLTTPDPSQLTGVRVDLPLPDCSVRPSDCNDVRLLNALDGFNVLPRISIPFSGPIDLATVSRDTVFFADSSGKRIGINKVVWERAANTLHAEPARVLLQHTTYALVVTDGVKAADGSELDASRFRHELAFGQDDDPHVKAYRKTLLDSLTWSGVGPGHVVDASVFTTQSVTAISEKIRRQIDASTPAPATFGIGTNGERAVFPIAAVDTITERTQISTAPEFDTGTFSPGGFLESVGSIAYGRFRSPGYQAPDLIIPSYPTRTGRPVPLSTNDVYFTLYLPPGPKPAGGWPVAIFGHGLPSSRWDAVLAAPVMAQNGLALIAINAVGQGGGPLGTITVARTNGPAVTVPAGGRSVDQNGDGAIDPIESVAPPLGSLVGTRDFNRQTAVDLMQLVREIEVGVDVDGDSTPDLNPDEISYFGQSFGGNYGAQLMVLDPPVHQGVLNVAGGPVIDGFRLSPFNRFVLGLLLLFRTPSLFNGDPGDLTSFEESTPLRDQPPLVDSTPGAAAIQEYVDRVVWAQNAGDAVAYAPYLRAHPLDGVEPKAVIVQFAKGDELVPNPSTSALVRSGELEDRTTYFRNDLALAREPCDAGDPAKPCYPIKLPHGFLFNVANAPAKYALAAQQQIATFFTSHGETTIDPDGPEPYFETPIAGPLPESVNLAP